MAPAAKDGNYPKWFFDAVSSRLHGCCDQVFLFGAEGDGHSLFTSKVIPNFMPGRLVKKLHKTSQTLRIR